MKIETCVVGQLQTNCYLLEKDNEVIVIDPGDDFQIIKEKINNRKVIGCLITHHHFDHIGALEEVLKEYNIKENDFKKINWDYEIIETKGHTNDSISFYFSKEKIMFSGDFIFYRSIGRTDLGGNDLDMIKSLKMISEYPDDIKIYPGHGETTILGEEKRRFSYYY